MLSPPGNGYWRLPIRTQVSDWRLETATKAEKYPCSAKTVAKCPTKPSNGSRTGK